MLNDNPIAYVSSTIIAPKSSIVTTLNQITTMPGLVSIGTIGTGVWQGTAIGDSYLANSYAILAGRSGGQILIGGIGTTDDLTLQTTSGVGAIGADMHFLVGNNGATEAMTILNSGAIGISAPLPLGKLQIGGALNFTREANAFGTSSIYTAFVMGDMTGATAPNGGLYCAARYDKSTEPFSVLSAWDNGSVRILYFGGGNWGVPDATELRFFAAPTYTETNNTAFLMATMKSTGTTFSNGNVGIGADHVTTGRLLVNGAINLTKEANAFGTSSIYTALVIGHTTGATANNGGLYCIGRNNKSHEPFTALCGWDNGESRILYFGGGSWDVPDATKMRFFAADTYTETNNTGLEMMTIDTVGVLVTRGVMANTMTSITLGAGVTTFAITSSVMKVTGNAGANTLATITGGVSGIILTLIFVDALVTITDDATNTANTVNLSAAFTSSSNDTISLVFDGTSWREVSRSVN